MVMLKDKVIPDDSSSSHLPSENISDEKTTYIVVDSVGDCDDMIENNQLDSEMTEPVTFDNGKAGKQQQGKQSAEISPGLVNSGKAGEQPEAYLSLSGDMEVLKGIKSPERENISVINGILEIPPQRSNSPPSKALTDENLNFESHDTIKNGFKHCVVNCSMTEEEVKNKIQNPKTCDGTKSFDENKNCSNSNKADSNLESDFNEISLLSNQEAPANQNCNTGNHGKELNDGTKTNKMFCSTPLNKAEIQEKAISKETEFEDMSPLVQPMSKTRNLKRKNLKLESIQEADEDSCDSISEKKIKIDNENENVIENEISDSSVKIAEDTMAQAQYEAPAKSILKKWQPSFTSRNSSTSLAVNEEGDGEDEDDFEVVYKSLTEELNKSSLYIDALEKESQLDDDKFEEIWRGLDEELGDKTSLTSKSMDAYKLSESNKTLLSVKSMLLNDSTQGNDTDDDTLKNDTSSSSSLNVTVEAKSLEVTPAKELSNDGKVLQPRENTICERADKERTVTIITKPKQNLDTDSTELNENTAPQINACKQSDRLVNRNDLEVDEEEILLGGDKKDKPYHFVEYVSEDPQENEDNYNPEWKRLGELTNDEDRYRAVRDRWRSLIPPDPNKDLTCRQWRERNKLPQNTLNPVNNKYHLIEDTARTEQCTAVFDMKIDSIMEELEKTRKKILVRRNIDFEELAKQQDEEQRQFILIGGNNMQFAFLHKRQLEQCRQLKEKHDSRIRSITAQAEQKIKLLKDACDEVMLFQKFYKGVGNDHNNGDEILYMTSTQVEELVETEDMLETYESLYTG